MVFKHSLVLILALCYVSSNGQYDTIVKDIFELNNEFKYNESTTVLKEIINNRKSTKVDKMNAVLMLSDTYKRLYDYNSVFKYLNQAEKYASTLEDSSKIEARKAMAYFDTHNYTQAQSIMNNLESTGGVSYLHEEDKAIINMQQGYLMYLKNNYSVAEKYYRKAIQLMDEVRSCNRPIVMVKQLQLYASTDQISKLQPTYERAIKHAKRCDIVKYEIYATDEYKTILHELGLYKEYSKYNHIKDSLVSAYDNINKLSELRDKEESQLESTLQNEKKKKRFFVTAALLGIILAIIFLFIYRSYKKKYINLSSEHEEIKKNLEHYISLNSKSKDEPIRSLIEKNVFTDRQELILKHLMEGKSNTEISLLLHISTNTVKYHIKNIYTIFRDNEVEFQRPK